MTTRTPPVYELHHAGRSEGAPKSAAPHELDSLPLPLLLQSSASRAVWRHVARGAIRVHFLVTADALALAALRALVHRVREGKLIGPEFAAAAGRLIRVGAFPHVEMLAAVILGLAVFGNYGAGDRRRDAKRVFAGSTLGISLIAWGQLWAHWSGSALAGYAIVLVVGGCALVATRSLLDRLVAIVRKESVHAARTLVVGTPFETSRMAEYRGLLDRAEFNIIGVIDESDAESLGRRIHRERIETVVLMGKFARDRATSFVRVAERAGCQVLRVLEAPPEFEPQLVWRRGTPLLQLTRPGLRGQQLFLKRLFDIVSSATLLVAASPVFVLVGLGVRLSSRGPVFFRQIRVGRGGHRFKIHKFRTMVVDAERLREGMQRTSVYSDPRLFKVPNDPRITRVGRLLRRSSLDELPQLWDVLRGRMSLVGPRPPLPSEVALYEAAHYLRFDMKPGITGPWQVGGRNRVTDFDEVLRLEADYIRDWTLLKDFAILVRTVPAVLRMDGAH